MKEWAAHRRTEDVAATLERSDTATLERLSLRGRGAEE
jgi:hypothetical protein